MNKIQKLIAHIFSKNSIKVWSVFLIFVFVFVAQTYAATGVSDSTVNTLSYYLHILLSIMSWIWIILANLAGKLMTNDILYGSFLHLDASLWTLWNIMKNFANFALGFMVLYAIVINIFSGPFGKDAGERSPINIIKKTLIAGVLIQSSWFLMGALVDMSTIMTSAIGAFPSQFIASNQSFQGNMYTNMKSLGKNKITFDPKDEEHMIKIDTNENFNPDDDDIKKLLDTITPSYDSVSGPLLFLGFSVFNFNDFENIGSSSNDNTPIDKWGDLFLSLGLSSLIIVFFTIMMFFIFMFNLFRLIILWLLIPLLPIILLLHVFKLTEKLGGASKGMDLSKFLSLKTLFLLVFKPIIMVGSLSIVLVILVIMKSMIAGNKDSKMIFEDQGNMVIESRQEDNGKYYTSTMKSDGIFEFSMTGVKDTFADIIVYFFGLFLIFFLVKMAVSFKTGISFIDDSLENTFKSFENILTSLPIIPVAGGIGINSLKQADIGQAATRLAGIDVAGQQSRISSLLGLGSTFSSLSPTTMNKEQWLKSAVSTGKSMGLTTSGAMINNPEFLAKFEEWNNYYKNNNNNNNNMQINPTNIDKAFKGIYDDDTPAAYTKASDIKADGVSKDDGGAGK